MEDDDHLLICQHRLGAMITCFSAVLNVVIRRESAYLIEERIKEIVDGGEGIMDPVLDRIEGCEYATNAAPFVLLTERLKATWLSSQSLMSVLPSEATPRINPPWLGRRYLPALLKMVATLRFASSG
jgi:hypothetical protein